MTEGFMTTDEVAWRFQVTRVTVRRWCQQGRFPGAKLIGSSRRATWIIPSREVDAFSPPTKGGNRRRKTTA